MIMVSYFWPFRIWQFDMPQLSPQILAERGIGVLGLNEKTDLVDEIVARCSHVKYMSRAK